MTLDDKISFISGFTLTTVTSISFMGIMQGALVGLAGGFFGLLGKEIYYSTKNKITSGKFKVWLIGLYDKTIGKFKKWF